MLRSGIIFLFSFYSAIGRTHEMGRKADRQAGESAVADPTGHRWQNGLRGGFYKSAEKPSGILLQKDSRQRSSSPDSVPGMIGGFHVYNDPSPTRRDSDRVRVRKHSNALHDIQHSLAELKKAAASKNQNQPSYYTTELHKLRNKENQQQRQMKDLKQAIRALNKNDIQANEYKEQDTERGRRSYPEREYVDSPASGADSDQDHRRVELQRLSEEIGSLLQLADGGPRRTQSKKRSRTPRTTHVDLTALTSRNVREHATPKVHQHPPQEYIYPTPSRRGRQRDKRYHRSHHQYDNQNDETDTPQTPDPPAVQKPSTSPEWLRRARPSARPGSTVPSEPHVTPTNTVRQHQQQPVTPGHLQQVVLPGHLQPPVRQQVQEQAVQPAGAWSQTPQQYGGPTPTATVGVGSSPARNSSWPPRQATPPRHQQHHVSTSPGPGPTASAQHVGVGGTVTQQTSPQSSFQPPQQSQQQQSPGQRNWASQKQPQNLHKVRTPPGRGQQQQQQQQQQELGNHQQKPQGASPTPWVDVQQEPQPPPVQGGWMAQMQPQHAHTQQQQNASPNPWGEPHRPQQPTHWAAVGTPVHERLPPPPWEQPATPEPTMWNDNNSLRGKVTQLENTLQRKVHEQETTEHSLLKEIQTLKHELGRVQEQQHQASHGQGYVPSQNNAPQYVTIPQQQQQQCF